MSGWGWPQMVIAGLMLIGLGRDLAKDGEPKTGAHSFGFGCIGAGLMAWLLYMGGFWTPAP